MNIFLGGPFTTWTGWSTCTAPCGGGITIRTRTCTDARPVDQCEGTESKSCNLQLCPSTNIPERTWGPWMKWLECTATCGSGVQVLMRKCTDDQTECEQYQKRDCILAACPPLGELICRILEFKCA